MKTLVILGLIWFTRIGNFGSNCKSVIAYNEEYAHFEALYLDWLTNCHSQANFYNPKMPKCVNVAFKTIETRKCDTGCFYSNITQEKLVAWIKVGQGQA